MRWDATRPVPWKRLWTEWVVIGLVVAFVAYFITHNHKVGSYVGIVLAGLIYVAFGAALAKFGYARKTLRQLRAEAAAAPPRQVGRSAPSASTRPKPAPTKRTSSGPSNRPQKKKR
jgi:uncharacterized membrane protein YeaQ/YmgE (transglycosylase-associated protein family)